MSPSSKHDGDMEKPLTILEASAAFRRDIYRFGASVARAMRLDSLAASADRHADDEEQERQRLRREVTDG